MISRARSALTAVIAIVLGVAAPGAIDAVRAQQAENAASSPFAPIETPTLDPELLKPPKPAHDDRAVKVDTDKQDKAPSEFKLPNRIDLGKSALEFNAGRTSDINPRTGFDSGEAANMQKIGPGKTERVTPDYFGLKLTTPTH
jgi:hypothetical protein